MILTPDTLSSIEYVTRIMYPDEMCGIITKNDDFKQITNISETPTKSFELHPMEFYKEKDNFITEPEFTYTCELLIKLARFDSRLDEIPIFYDYGKKIGKSKLRVGRNFWRLLVMLRRLFFASQN